MASDVGSDDATDYLATVATVRSSRCCARRSRRADSAADSWLSAGVAGIRRGGASAGRGAARDGAAVGLVDVQRLGVGCERAGDCRTVSIQPAEIPLPGQMPNAAEFHHAALAWHHAATRRLLARHTSRRVLRRLLLGN